MKKILMSIAAMALVLVGCNKDFEGRLTDLENRVSALEEYVTNLNNEVSGIQTIVTSLQSKVYVTGVEAVKNDSGAETGYKITFNQGNPIIINHGKTGDKGQTGAPGLTPGIDMFEGEWYWKYVGGEWILDSAGNKIPVTKSLKFEVNAEGNLYVSIDGAPVELVGNVQGAQGDSWFDGVTVDEKAGTVTISIAGSEHDLVLPFNAAAADDFALELQLPDTKEAFLGGRLQIGYTLVGCEAADAVVFVQAPEDWAVELNEAAQRVSLKVGEKAGRVVIYAINNNTGDVKAKFVNYNPEELFVVDVKNKNYYFSPKGETIEVTVSTGIEYRYQASNSWFSVPDPVTKASVEHNKFTITAPENTTGSTKKGDLTFLAVNGGTELFSMSFEQRSYIPALLADEEGNVVEWRETFGLYKYSYSSTPDAKKKGIFTIELSDDFSKGTYKLNNMFVAALYYLNGQPIMNQGGTYYADFEGNELVIDTDASIKSYGFTKKELRLAFDSENMTFALPGKYEAYVYGDGFNRQGYLDSYVAKVSVPVDPAVIEALQGQYTYTCNYNGTAIEGDLLIAPSDNGELVTNEIFPVNSYGTTYTASYYLEVVDGGKAVELSDASAYGHSSFGGVSTCKWNVESDGSLTAETLTFQGGTLTDFVATPKAASSAADPEGSYSATWKFASNSGGYSAVDIKETMTVTKSGDAYVVTNMFTYSSWGVSSSSYPATFENNQLVVNLGTYGKVALDFTVDGGKKKLSFTSSSFVQVHDYGFYTNSYQAVEL